MVTSRNAPLALSRTLAAIAGAALALTVAGCGGKAPQPSGEQPRAQESAPAGQSRAKGPVIAVESAWARPSAEGVMTSAVYFTLRNTGDQEDALVAASTDVAGKAEIHETKKEDAADPGGKKESKMEGQTGAMGSMAMGGAGTMTMKMQPVDRVPVPAGGSAELRPGGLHVMLMDLKQPLKVGDTFRLTLRFEKSAEQTIEVTVRQP